MSRDASWVIYRSVTDFSHGYSDSYEYILRVTGTATVNDMLYWVLENDDGEFDSYIRVANDIVYTFAGIADFGSSGDSSDSDNDTPNPYEDELPLLRLYLESDTTYDIMSYSSSEFGASFTLTWIGRYMGTEDITVTAGTFESCRKYEITYDAVAVGGGAAQREITTTLLWLAPDVGTVRSVETKTDGEQTIYKSEEELIGFSIP